MYSSSDSLAKHIDLVHILLAIQVLLIRSVSSLNLTNAYLHHKCRPSDGTYMPGSKYEENLNYLTKSVSAYKFHNGYTFISYGKPPNLVGFIFECRGDSKGSYCRSCYATAVAGLRRRCPRNKGATIWYDQCIFDVGTDDFPSPEKIDYENTFSIRNPNSIGGEIESFNKKTMDLFHTLYLKAISSEGMNWIYYAAGDERVGANKLYAMVQCAQSQVTCKDCLKSSFKELSKCCSGKQGARVFMGRSCNIRYELYPFLRA